MTLRICRTGKAGYPTQEKAEQVLGVVRRSNLNAPLSGLHVPNRAYECPYCQEWHLTHRKPPRK